MHFIYRARCVSVIRMGIKWISYLESCSVGNDLDSRRCFATEKEMVTHHDLFRVLWKEIVCVLHKILMRTRFCRSGPKYFATKQD